MLLLESNEIPLLNGQIRQEQLALADRAEELGWPAQARNLRCCGLRRTKTPEGARVGPVLRCGMWICPACRARRQMAYFHAYRPVVAEAINSGAASFLTFTAPGGPSPLHERVAQQTSILRSFARLHAWRSTRGFKQHLGVLVAWELAPGAKGRGHPHYHLLVGGPDSHGVGPGAEWLRAHWLKHAQGAKPEAQEACPLPREEEAWGPRLHYLLKGPAPAPGWPDALLDEALQVFASRMWLTTAYGLFSRRKSVKAPDINP